MTFGIVLLSFAAFIGSFCYKKPFFERKIIKNIPLIHWINLMIIPIFFYLGLAVVVRNILVRDRVTIVDIDDFYLISVLLIFLIYTFVGMSLHFVGKVLSLYIKPDHDSLAYQVNSVFHKKFSHYLSFICSMITLFGIAIIEINYPAITSLNKFQGSALALSGALFGIAGVHAIHNALENYYRTLTYFCFVLLFTLSYFVSLYQINIQYHPYIVFMISFYSSVISMFIARQLVISTRLHNRKKARIVNKFLHI
jgi:hypothetical protein